MVPFSRFFEPAGGRGGASVLKAFLDAACETAPVDISGKSAEMVAEVAPSLAGIESFLGRSLDLEDLFAHVRLAWEDKDGPEGGEELLAYWMPAGETAPAVFCGGVQEPFPRMSGEAAAAAAVMAPTAVHAVCRRLAENLKIGYYRNGPVTRTIAANLVACGLFAQPHGKAIRILRTPRRAAFAGPDGCTCGEFLFREARVAHALSAVTRGLFDLRLRCRDYREKQDACLVASVLAEKGKSGLLGFLSTLGTERIEALERDTELLGTVAGDGGKTVAHCLAEAGFITENRTALAFRDAGGDTAAHAAARALHPGLPLREDFPMDTLGWTGRDGTTVLSEAVVSGAVLADRAVWTQAFARDGKTRSGFDWAVLGLLRQASSAPSRQDPGGVFPLPFPCTRERLLARAAEQEQKCAPSREDADRPGRVDPDLLLAFGAAAVALSRNESRWDELVEQGLSRVTPSETPNEQRLSNMLERQFWRFLEEHGIPGQIEADRAGRAMRPRNGPDGEREVWL